MFNYKKGPLLIGRVVNPTLDTETGRIYLDVLRKYVSETWV
jgi:hypothetical protein